MKHIEFEKLCLQNFLSVGSDPLVIDITSGINIINGENKDKEDSKNGVGKSTIIDALFFGLFGKTLRDLNNNFIINYFNKKKCIVQLYFNVEENGVKTFYKITRGLKPAKLIFEKSDNDTGKMVALSQTKPETNKDILKRTGFTYEAFLYDTVNDFNNTVPFLAQKGIAKRKFIENIFNLGVFSELLKTISKDFNASNKDLTIAENVLEELEKNIADVNTQKKSLDEKIKTQKAEYEEKKKFIVTQIKSLKASISKIDDSEICGLKSKKELLVGKLEKFDDKRDSVVSKKYEVKSEHGSALKIIKKLETTPNICVECGRKFSDTDKDKISSKIADLNDKITTFNAKMEVIDKNLGILDKNKKTFNAALTKINTDLNDINTLKINNKNTIARIKTLKDRYDDLNASINNLDNNNNFDELIKNLKNKIKTSNDSIELLNTNLNIYELSKFVVSEDGAKSYLINKLLHILNGKISHYLGMMNSNCVCMFDEYLDERIYNEKMDEISYFNFSGGERRRIDLAMLFAFIDIKKIRSNITTNIMLFDELFDSALDSKGIGDVMDILMEKQKESEKAVYVISHRPEASQYATGEIIHLIKENGFTRRKTNA